MISLTNSFILQRHCTFVLFLFIMTFSTTVFAQPKEPMNDPKMAKQYIAEILSQSEFKTTREEYHWRYIGNPLISTTPSVESTDSSSFDVINFMAQMIEVIFWFLLGISIILLIVYGPRWLEKWSFQSPNHSKYTANPRLLENIFEKQQLPANIPQQAWLFWQSGEMVAAISLLYRGALSTLINDDGLNIHDSATESECLRLVKHKEFDELYIYFSHLTSTWQNIAYAGRQPTDAEVQRLCREWQLYFR